MTIICEHCASWVATSWKQHKNRLKDMKGIPDARTNPCPQCGGTYWAIKPPPGWPPDPAGVEPMDRPHAARIVGWLAAAILAAALYILLTHYAHAQTTFRDANGRLSSTATRDSNGTVTMRDGSGRMTGTATRNSNGTTIFRDGSGRMTGTAERRR